MASWLGWLALAFSLPLVLMALAAAVHIALGGIIAPSPAIGYVLLVLANFFLVFLVGGPLGEELGWRGFGLPILQNHYNWRMASLILGVVWGAWHLPLFFSDGTSQNRNPLTLFSLSVVATSVLFAWLVNHMSGGVKKALILHTAINTWPTIIPVLPTDENYQPYALMVALGLLTQPKVVATKKSRHFVVKSERCTKRQGQK